MAKREYFKAIPSVYVLLERGGEILLLRRKNTSYYDGSYSLPAGHVEAGESLRTAAAREALEETGVKIKAQSLQLTHVLSRPTFEGDGDTRLDFFFVTKRWQNEPVNAEPEKCSELKWFPKKHLPEDVVPEVRQALEHVFNGVRDSEYGWEKLMA